MTPLNTSRCLTTWIAKQLRYLSLHTFAWCPGLPHLLISIWLVKQHGFAVQLPVLVAFYISELFGEFPVVGQTSRFIKCVWKQVFLDFEWHDFHILRSSKTFKNSFRGYNLRSNIWPKFMLSWVLQSTMAKTTILKWLQWPQKRASQANMMVVNGGFNDQTRGV
jgi:hypothetical protein